MALDASIYARFAPQPKSVADFDREYEDAQAARQGRQMNALKLLMAQRQEQDAQRTIGEQEGIRNALAQLGQGATDEGRVNALRALGTQTAFGQADALEKSLLERKKTQALIDKDATDTRAKSLKMIREGLGFVYSNPTPEAAMQQIALLEQQLQTDLTPYKQQVAGFTTPEQLKQWAAGHALEIDKALPSFVTRDTGGAQQTIRQSPVTGQVEVINSVAKTQSPDNAASNARMAAEGAANRAVQMRGQNLVDARERATPRGQIVQSDQGPVLVDPRTGKSVPVVGPDGAPLGPKLKDVPAPIQKAMLENATNVRRAEQALALVQGKDVGTSKGDKSATGLKGFLPNQVLNRIDAEGVDTRAAIADLGSLVIHDRSGAAVTAAEFPRLAPFIPTEKDDQATVEKKLKRFVQVYKDELAAMQAAYGEGSGYRQSGKAAPAAGGFKYLGTE